MKKSIFCMMMAVLTMSAYAIDVGSTAPEVNSETLFGAPEVIVMDAPSMECVTVNVFNMTIDMLMVSVVEVKSVVGVPAPKPTPVWFTNGLAFSYDAAKLAPPNHVRSTNRCSRLNYNRDYTHNYRN